MWLCHYAQRLKDRAHSVLSLATDLPRGHWDPPGLRDMHDPRWGQRAESEVALSSFNPLLISPPKNHFQARHPNVLGKD